MREICLDCETTGFNPDDGHRIVEIGCVELNNHRPTGRTWHAYFNPKRLMPKAAERVHGLTNDFLKNKPTFDERCTEFIMFIGDAPLVAHNAPFDLSFLNAELEKARCQTIPAERMIDTLRLACQKHPGSPNTLDNLCKRYGIIDKKKRSTHGALLDAELLAKVYLELMLERAPTFDFGTVEIAEVVAMPAQRQRPAPLAPRLTADEIAAHRAFIASAITAPIWNDYLLQVREAA